MRKKCAQWPSDRRNTNRKKSSIIVHQSTKIRNPIRRKATTTQQKTPILIFAVTVLYVKV